MHVVGLWCACLRQPQPVMRSVMVVATPAGICRWLGCCALALVLLLAGAAFPASAKRSTKNDDDVGRVQRKLLLLPTLGPADEPSRRELNKRLREALQREEESVVVDAKVTADVLADSKAMGLVCKPDDGECLIKLGVLADVGLVLVPVARGRRSLQVECGLWEVDTATELRHVTLELSPSDTEMVDLLVDRVFGRSVEAPKVGTAVGGVVETKAPEPACVEGSLDCPRSVARVDDDEEDGGGVLPWLGLGAAGLGGVFLLGGVIGASLAEVRAIELTKDPVANAKDLEEIAPIGGGLWVTAIAGTVVTTGGLALWWFTREVEAASAEDQLADAER
jgi:hypothetical protein